MENSEKTKMKSKYKKIIAGTSIITITLLGFAIYQGVYVKNKGDVKSVENVNLQTKITEKESEVKSEPTPTSDIITVPTPSPIVKKAPGTDLKVDKVFFDNSLFIGDSVTLGIEGYAMLDKAKVFAGNGQDLMDADKFVTGKVKNLKVDKIFVLLGTNDLLNGITSAKYAEYYGNLITVLRSEAPNAVIYVQSIFPVESFIDTKEPLAANSRIDEFNKAIQNMPKDVNVKYLDVASVFKNEKGAMFEGITADGIHINYNYYNAWLNYLQNNAK